jgi:imidazolonepropionase-like amidohydrolase
VKPLAMVAVTLGNGGRESQRGKSPGTRSKEIAMLRAEFIKAQEYQRKLDKAASDTGDKEKKDNTQARDLRLETLGRVLKGEVPLLVTVDRANDIVTAIRLAQEFGIHMVLDGAAECYMVLDRIKAAGYPIILHPTMERAFGESENVSFETAAKLKAAGIRFALQSGYESYVPKTRVVLFEAAVAAANGLSFGDALASITIDAARIIGVDQRVGSLEAGKDGDVALYDGDPFEYTTHCVGVVTDGKVVSEVRR